MRRAAFHGCLLDINVRYVAFPSSRLFSPCAFRPILDRRVSPSTTRGRHATRTRKTRHRSSPLAFLLCPHRVPLCGFQPPRRWRVRLCVSDTPHGLRCVSSPRPGELADAHGGTSRTSIAAIHVRDQHMRDDAPMLDRSVVVAKRDPLRDSPADPSACLNSARLRPRDSRQIFAPTTPADH